MMELESLFVKSNKRTLEVEKKSKRVLFFQFAIGLNRSDITYGWNGFHNTYTIFYKSSDEDYYEREHSFSVIPQVFYLINTRSN